MRKYSSTHDVKKPGTGRSSGRPLFVSLAASLIHQPSPILRKGAAEGQGGKGTDADGADGEQGDDEPVTKHPRLTG